LQDTKYFVLALVAACTLWMAPIANAAVPCKSGQTAAQKGGAKCVSAPAKKANAVASHAPATKSTAKSKGKTRYASKTQAKGKGRPNPQVASMEPPPVRAAADCESTQAMLQGAAGQCPSVAVPASLMLPSAPQANTGASCFEALAASNASRRLAHKVPFLAASAASPEALDNKSIPGKMEKEELHSVISGYGMCLDMTASWRRETYTPAAVGALDAYWQEVQSTLTALAAGKKTYGEAARAVAQSDKAYKSQLGSLQ
jgi:hypothetical protein